MSKPDGGQAMARVIVGRGQVFNMIYVPKSGPLNQNQARSFFEGLRIR